MVADGRIRDAEWFGTFHGQLICGQHHHSRLWHTQPEVTLTIEQQRPDHRRNLVMNQPAI
jgi:hypothetical protein